METLVEQAARYVSLSLDLVAIVIIAIGGAEALVGIARVAVGRHPGGTERREVWLQFARWLVAGLTFQLAADVVHTALAPTWDEIGHLGAIAVLRTFISFFLDRDMERARELQAAGRERAVARPQ